MSSVPATHSEVTPPARRRRVLVPSILSALVLGLLAAILVGVIVHGLVSGSRRADDTMVSAYLAWFIFFLVGIGAFNFPVKWGLGRPDTTHEQELELAGKDEGVWRYFRFCTDHKVVGIQYLVTVLVLFLVGGVASWMIRLEQARTGAKVFTPATYNTIVGMHGLIMIATTIIMLSAVIGNYMVPIMIGANDMAFPRLNALSYWILFPVVPDPPQRDRPRRVSDRLDGLRPPGRPGGRRHGRLLHDDRDLCAVDRARRDQHGDHGRHHARARHDVGKAPHVGVGHHPVDPARADRVPGVYGGGGADPARPHGRHVLL